MNDSGNGGLAFAILAAGTSTRFGDQDKLAAILGGKMLGLHVANNLSGLDCDHKIIVAPDNHICAPIWSDLGYRIVSNDNGGLGQSVSVRMAAAEAQKAGADALLICLADMPFVDVGLVEQLLALFDTHDCSRIVASTAKGAAMPPAIFPARMFDQLASLKGDKGARALLQNAICIEVNEHILMDIDTPDNLAEANKTLQ